MLMLMLMLMLMTMTLVMVVVVVVVAAAIAAAADDAVGHAAGAVVAVIAVVVVAVAAAVVVVAGASTGHVAMVAAARGSLGGRGGGRSLRHRHLQGGQATAAHLTHRAGHDARWSPTMTSLTASSLQARPGRRAGPRHSGNFYKFSRLINFLLPLGFFPPVVPKSTECYRDVKLIRHSGNFTSFLD